MNLSPVYLLVQSSPAVQDPRELHTILIFSLRSLFGECEPHSCLVEVLECVGGGKAIIKCPLSSVDSVRAALTLCTPPQYLQSSIYRFDVLQIETSQSKLQI
jgi:RNase P/RNase MRP subunit POP5